MKDPVQCNLWCTWYQDYERRRVPPGEEKRGGIKPSAGFLCNPSKRCHRDPKDIVESQVDREQTGHGFTEKPILLKYTQRKRAMPHRTSCTSLCSSLLRKIYNIHYLHMRTKKQVDGKMKRTQLNNWMRGTSKKDWERGFIYLSNLGKKVGQEKKKYIKKKNLEQSNLYCEYNVQNISLRKNENHFKTKWINKRNIVHKNTLRVMVFILVSSCSMSLY